MTPKLPPGFELDAAPALPPGFVLDGAAPAQQKPARPQWSDLPGNIHSSAAKFAGGIYDTVTSPVQTIKGLADVAAGSLRNAMPQGLRSAIDRMDPNPEAGQRASDSASAVGQFYKDRYGSMEGARNALITDPVGVAGDASMLLGVGGGLASAAGAGRTGNALMQASKFTNPLSVVAPIVKGTAKAVGAVAKPVLGMTTGTGSENVAQAFKAGKTGDAAFIDNLRGNVPASDVLESARTALQNMRSQKSADYKAGIGTTAADTTRLNFAPIDQALADVVGSLKEGNRWKIGPDELRKVKEIEQVVREWRVDPKSHTPIGLDALKQRLDAIYPDSPKQSQAQRTITAVRNAVKDNIVAQSPEYAKTMAAYEEAMSLEKQITAALSLGKKTADDTALRKLQSLSRNNANANYGYRADLARALETQGGQSLMPSIAGQALNSWTPRSLSGQGAGLATLGGAAVASNPAVLGLLPFQSPRAVGLGAYGLGRTAGGMNRLGSVVSADDLAAMGLTANQLNILQGK
jgi:hypothetical protein